MITLATKQAPPGWALWERYLLDAMSRAAKEFVRRYTRADGTLVWRENWPGMDGSDDAYESFFNFPLLAALGGDLEIDALARFEWEAITRQFREYGQIYREFDAYYDWMHHGESSLLFYYFGLTDPDDLRMRARAVRFAAMYTGEDPEADNYDPALRLIRSPITGSRGPRFENSAEDWVTHRPILAHYPPPFDDVPGIPPDAKRADWNDDAIFANILQLLNARMMRGDVPLNLTATSLIANAFLYTGEQKYTDWVRDYVSAWKERAQANGGLLPDNVGPGGKIGECMDGKWWGGYYGWRWPHGFMTLIEPTAIAASNLLLLTGKDSSLDIARQLLDRVYEQGKEIEGRFCIPHRHGDNGWYDFRPLTTGMHADVPAANAYPVALWYLSMQPEDAARVARWRGGSDWSHVSDARGKGDNVHTPNWYAYIQGENPDYPEAILRVNYAEMCRRGERMNTDTTDPETWDVHHWQDLNPVVLEGLVQLMLGGPQTIYHGGLLHCRLRYFDLDRRRPGVPPDVAALVSKVDTEGVEVALVNLHPMEARRVLVQAGAFGEHRFTGATLLAEAGNGSEIAIDGPALEVRIAPGSGGKLRLGMQRYANMPSYAFPWRRR
jgi:hypothetical protein